jgi:predicted aspartyl protease
MTFSFNSQQGLVLISAVLTGPKSTAALELVLDTGATYTLINEAALRKAGYDPAQVPTRTWVTTTSGVVFAPYIPLLKFSALGIDRAGFAVLGHTLPPTATGDGLLGLDFFRGRVLTLDFQKGELTLT